MQLARIRDMRAPNSTWVLPFRYEIIENDAIPLTLKMKFKDHNKQTLSIYKARRSVDTQRKKKTVTTIGMINLPHLFGFPQGNPHHGRGARRSSRLSGITLVFSYLDSACSSPVYITY
jgi:hypothetical protein